MGQYSPNKSKSASKAQPLKQTSVGHNVADYAVLKKKQESVKPVAFVKTIEKIPHGATS